MPFSWQLNASSSTTAPLSNSATKATAKAAVPLLSWQVLLCIALLVSTTSAQQEGEQTPQEKDKKSAGVGARRSDNLSREQMWPAPTDADWKKPCLIKWQRTWEDAQAVAKATKRPILICVNMDGEIASEHYAGIRYRQPEVAKLYEPYITVIASVYRHTPRDYDEKGMRIPCPRFGGVTCSEHINIEPIIYEKFLDGRRIAPRHIAVELDGKESYDVFYAFDTASVFDQVHEGIESRPHLRKPIVRGDRSIIERVASRDRYDREAVEKTFAASDLQTQRAIMKAAIANGSNVPISLLRMAIFGVDKELASLARQSLAQADHPDAVDLISEALRVTMPDTEREALLAAMERIGKKSAKAETLAKVHGGLNSEKTTVKIKEWSEALSGQEYPAPKFDRDMMSEKLKEFDNIRESKDAKDHLAMAEAFLARAQDDAESATRSRQTTRALLDDAEASAARAMELGAKGWRIHALSTVVAWLKEDGDKARHHAEAAMADVPHYAADRNSMIVLGFFADQRRKAIADHIKAKKKWPKEWLTDLHGAYSLLAKHPHGDASQVAAHYDFLFWLGALRKSRDVLKAGLTRFPSSGILHERQRQRALRKGGVAEIEAVYQRQLAQFDDADKSPASVTLRWFSAYASIDAAEAYRRQFKGELALKAYDRSIAQYERVAQDQPDSAKDCRHYQALAISGKARIYYEQQKETLAAETILACLAKSPNSAASLDGLNLSPVLTAKIIEATLRAKKQTPMADKIGAALKALDPELLKLPAYERERRPTRNQ